jgi:hypothetical protein
MRIGAAQRDCTRLRGGEEVERLFRFGADDGFL